MPRIAEVLSATPVDTCPAVQAPRQPCAPLAKGLAGQTALGALGHRAPWAHWPPRLQLRKLDLVPREAPQLFLATTHRVDRGPRWQGGWWRGGRNIGFRQRESQRMLQLALRQRRPRSTGVFCPTARQQTLRCLGTAGHRGTPPQGR